MTGSLFLPAHTSDEGTLADIQRWMWMLTAMRRRKWLQLVIGWTAQNSVLKLNAYGRQFHCVWYFQKYASFLSSQKIIILYCLIVVEGEVVETQLM